MPLILVPGSSVGHASLVSCVVYDWDAGSTGPKQVQRPFNVEAMAAMAGAIGCHAQQINRDALRMTASIFQEKVGF
ncbi:hypothetical protein VTN77DRAFT_4662 [Rasamsonia byssochlamydoides]|uniref:uncharacterized protein n=1 Tax=Rasamsonia byssochlamydoides TaxID=89139 RepID=UPI0037436A75